MQEVSFSGLVVVGLLRVPLPWPREQPARRGRGLPPGHLLPFIVAASMIGVVLLSVLLVPLIAATILGRAGRWETASSTAPASMGALGR